MTRALIHAINAIPERALPTARRLDPQRILARIERGGVDVARLPSRVTDALEALCRSLVDDARLNLFGQQNLIDLIVTGLHMRGLLDDRPRSSRPTAPLRPPLIVCGLPRSGTTFLHRMLSAVDGARALPLWEAIFPLNRRRFDRRRREVDLKLRLFRYATGGRLDPIHYVRTDLPDECMYLLRLDLRASLFWVGCPCIGYLDWLLAQDLSPTYAMYRRVLEALQQATPHRRLTLKNPSHTLDVPGLLAALPEAMVVRTHRDPLEVAPSYHKLVTVSHASTSRGVEPARVIAANTRYLTTAAQRMVALDAEATGGRVCDVDYRDLVADPVATVAGIYQYFGLPFTEATERTLDGFRRRNPKNAHGANAYSIEQFGQTPEELRSLFVAYRSRFIER